jgi:hypothetical protein
MSDSQDYSNSPDNKVEQLLKWKNDEHDVRATHVINLAPKKDVKLVAEPKTYAPQDEGWEDVKNEFKLNAGPQDYISVMRYEETAGSSTTAHKVTFKSETEPYTLRNRTHHVVATCKGTGGEVSTAKGIAL